MKTEDPQNGRSMQTNVNNMGMTTDSLDIRYYALCTCEASKYTLSIGVFFR